jgi:hypothetical protein
VAEAGAEAAVAEQHRGGAVAHHLGQARIQVDLEVEVRVDVQQSGHQPVAVGIDDCARRPAAAGRRPRGDTPVADGDVDGSAAASPLPSNTLARRKSTSQVIVWLSYTPLDCVNHRQG